MDHCEYAAPASLAFRVQQNQCDLIDVLNRKVFVAENRADRCERQNGQAGTE